MYRVKALITDSYMKQTKRLHRVAHSCMVRYMAKVMSVEGWAMFNAVILILSFDHDRAPASF